MQTCQGADEMTLEKFSNNFFRKKCGGWFPAKKNSKKLVVDQLGTPKTT